MMKKLIVLFAALILITGLCFAQAEDNEDDFPGGGGGYYENDSESTAFNASSSSRHPKIELFDLEITLGYPIHWTNATHDQTFYWFNPEYMMEDKQLTANTAIGFALLFNFGSKAGFIVDVDFFHGTRLSAFSNPTSDYASLFGLNALIGPVFFLYNSSLLRIPLGVGGHLYYFSDDMWAPNLIGYTPVPGTPPPASPNDGFYINRSDFQVGPGVSLGVQFHFNSSLYIFSRVNVAVDIFRSHSMKYIFDDGAGVNDVGNPSETEFVISWQVKPALGLGIKF